MQPQLPPVVAAVAAPQPTLNNGNPTPKQLYDGLIDLLKILHHPDQQENIIYSSEIKEMLEQLFMLIPTIVEFDPKAPKNFNDQAAAFKDQMLTPTTFAKIRLLVANSPLASAFLKHLQTALTTSLQTKLTFCLNLKRIIKEEYTQKNTDLGYSGAVVIDFLTKLALPEKVKEVRKPSFTSRGGENSAQLSGIPGDARGHWFAAGPPAIEWERINLRDPNIGNRFPAYILQAIQQQYEDDGTSLDNDDGILPSLIPDVTGGEEGRYQILPREIPAGPGRIRRAFHVLLMREVHYERIRTVTEAYAFIVTFLANHPVVRNTMTQSAGWGENAAMNQAVIRAQLTDVMRAFIAQNRLEDDRPQQAP
ncbi:MAG: hypothetical protein LLG04_09575 [Parachlamydia sp.]|nr:hypothetical protein [Parachlamydia sp.]